MKRFLSRNIIYILLAWLFSDNLRYCLALDEYLPYTNSIFLLVIFGVYYYFISKITYSEEWKLQIKSYLGVSCVFCFFFFGAMLSGVQLELQGYVDFTNIKRYISLVILTICGTPMVAKLIHILQKRVANGINPQSTKQNTNRKFFIKVYIILMLSYLLVLLAVWPGFFVYDAEVETYMVFTDKYSAHHPMAHVLLLGWVMKVMYKIVPSYNVGIATYLILQMLVVSACFAYMLAFMHRIGLKKWILNCSIAFLAFFPTVSMFVCCTTKDVYFSAGVVLFTTLMLELSKDSDTFRKSKSKTILLSIAALLIILFRNNGIYALTVFLPFFMIVYKKYWKKWIKIILAVVGIYCLFNVTVNAVFDVKPGEKAEMLCVPMQQLARAHYEAKECFTEEELETMYSLIPETILQNYNPKLADNVKVNFLEDNFKGAPGKYFKLWLEIGLKRPDIYINSFLMNTYDYWYPDTIVDGYTGKWIVDREYADSSYFAYVTERPGISKPLIPFLAKFYEKISLEIYQHNIPVISMLFSMGFWLWVYTFTVMYLWKTNYRKQAFAFLPIGLIYMTVILGPIAIVRYVLYLFFGAPLIVALLFDTKVFKEDK